MISKYIKSLAGAAAAVVAFSGSADALSLSYSGQHHGSVNVAPTGSGTTSAGVLTMNSSSDSFLMWCLDLYSGLQNGNFTPLNGPFTGASGSNPNPYAGTNGPYLSNTQLANIEALFETNASAIDTIYTTVNNVMSAGFQLALWELIYEDSGSFDLASGDFQGNTGASVTNAANDFLGNLTGPIEQSYELTFWESDNNNGQNLVSIAAVPVPAAGLLLLTGLFGFGVAARRRKS